MLPKFLRQLISSFALSATAVGANAAPPLPALAASDQMLTVSGISSGGYMAVQFQVAYAQLVRGAGIIAGGPYFCAENSVSRALSNCMTPTAKDAPPDAETTLKIVEKLAAAGKIDSPKSLSDDRVWLLSGGQDKTVTPPVMDALASFYQRLLPADAIRYVKLPEAAHTLPSVTDTTPNACAISEPPYISRCQDFDAAGQLLSHLLGTLKPATSAADGEIISFDQRPFIKGGALDASLADEGYAFIPKTCHAGGCQVHVAFHGCRQNVGEIGQRFVEGAGYNRWAASNRLIILYPQTTSRSGLAFGSTKWVLNPKACWDWWGYTGDNYPTRDGIQLQAVRGMINALTQPLKR